MKKLILALVCFSSGLLAQTVYLRSPGTSFCSVIAATNTTPIRVTVSGSCGIVANGQFVLPVEIGGNTAANIHLETGADANNLARVVSGLSGSSFDLLDLAGGAVAGNGTYTNGGRISLATAYTLRSHPRVYLDGPGGAVVTSISNTGAGGRANASNPTFTALKNAQATWTETWGDDRSGAKAAASALRWLADGDSTARSRALYHLVNVAQMLPSIACDDTDGIQRGCQSPGSTWQDYPSQYLEGYAQAYSIMRGELSAPQRAAILDFWLNDQPWTLGGLGPTGTALTKPAWLVRGTGATITGVAGPVITMSSTAGITAGNIILNADSTYAYGVRVASVDSGTQITVSDAGLATGTFQVGPAWVNTQYGLMWHQKHFDPAVLCGGAIVNDVLARNCDVGYGPLAGYSGNGQQNLSVSRIQGYYALGLATCGDDLRGCLLLEQANEWYINLMLRRAETLWTGFTQSSSGFYSTGRMYNIVPSLAAMTRHSLVQTPDYLASSTIPANGLRWGYAAPIPELGIHMPTAEGGHPGIVSVFARSALSSLFHSPGLAEGQRYRNWLYNILPADQSYLRYNNGEYTWWLFLFDDPATGTATPTPTTSHFLETGRAACVAQFGGSLCPSNEGRLMSISASDWTSNRTYLGYDAAAYQAIDHAPQEAAGWLLISKAGKALLSNDSGIQDLMGPRSGRGYIEVGGTVNNLKTYPEVGGPIVPYWSAGNDSYSVANVDLAGAYKSSAGVLAAQRELMHLKGGAADYIIDHVKVTTSAPTQIRGWQHSRHYFCPLSSCVGFDDSTRTVANTQTGAKLISRALGVGGNVAIARDNFDGSYSGGLGYTHRWEVCPTTDGSTCNTSQSAAEWVVVHRPTTDTGAVMPPLVQRFSDAMNMVEIQDATAPKVAVFTALGTVQADATFTTTFSGTAQHLISGLPDSSSVAVTVDGSPVAGSPFTLAAGEHVIEFNATAGLLVIGAGAAAPPLGIVTASPLADCTVGEFCSRPLTAENVTGLAIWSLVSGTLPTGLSLNAAGVISGTPTIGITQVVTVRVTDDLGFAEKLLSIRALVEFIPATVHPIRFRLRSRQVADVAEIEFGSSPALGSVTSASCPGGACSLVVQAQTGLGVDPMYYRVRFRLAGVTVGLTSIRSVVVP